MDKHRTESDPKKRDETDVESTRPLHRARQSPVPVLWSPGGARTGGLGGGLVTLLLRRTPGVADRHDHGKALAKLLEDQKHGVYAAKDSSFF